MTAPTLSGLISSVTFLENIVNATPQLLDSDVTFNDPDNNFNGGSLRVTGLLAEDRIAIQNQGTTAGLIGVSGANISYGGTTIGSFTGGSGNTFTVTFNASATSVAIDALIQNLTYANVSDTPTASRNLVLNVLDALGEQLSSAPGAANFVQQTGANNPFGAIIGTIGTSGNFIFNAQPAFFDYDNDGDLDLFIGTSGQGIAFFKNNAGVFSQVTGASNPLNGIPGFPFYGAAPTFADLDGDGDLDLVVGDNYGNLFSYRNGTTGASGAFTAIAAANNPFNAINTSQAIGGYASPTFVDVDGDGDMDLVVGSRGGSFPATTGPLQYFRNGTTGAAGTFTQQTGASNPFAAVNVTDFSAPAFIDIDADGDMDLVVGSYNVGLQTWRNNGNGTFTQLTGANNPFNGASLGQYLAPVFADIDGDGDKDLIVGNNDGQLSYYRNTGTPPTSGQTITVNVTAQADNTAPVMDLNGAGAGTSATLGYTENAVATAIAPSATVTDSDSANFDTGTLTVSFTANGVAEDRLTILNIGTGAGQISVSGATVSFAGTAIGTFTGGTDGATPLVVTLNANATVAAVQALSQAIAYSDVSDTPSTAARTVQYVVTDGDGGTSSAVTATVNVTAVNDAPVLTGLSSSVTFLENTVNATPQIIDADVSLVDVEGNFNGGTLAVIGLAPQDRVSVFNEGTGAGQIGVSGINISYGGVVIGTAAGGVGNQFTVTLNAAATSVAVDALIQNLTYANVSDTPIGSRGLTIRVTDSQGANGSQVVTINVTAQDDAPVAVSDTGSVAANATQSISVLNNDTDIDGGSNTVATIAGQAASVGVAITLASGATATLNNDGTITYNPNGKFDYLVSPTTAATTGAANGSATDSFAYALNGGSSTTVTVTVTGVDGAGDQLQGNTGDNAVTGTGVADFIDLSQGGNDTVSTGAGNDSIFFGASFTAADRVDGGGGSNDQLGLRGDYTGGNALTLSGANLSGVETVALLAGFDYSVTALDDLLTTGQTMTIFGSGLGVGDNLTFNGSAESSGNFLVYGGLGTDLLTGGGGNDGFQFAAGRFNTATDVINGGSGNDQVALNAFSGTLSGTNLISIETVVLLSGSNSIVIADDWTPSGQSRTVFGSGLTQGATINGSAETNGKLALYGGSGNDVLTGGAGNDMIIGGAGADTIRGGLGADMLRGDGGADTFILGSAAESTSTTYDTLTGFDASIDRIDLPTTITAIDTAITVGTLSNGSFDSDLSAALAGLGANHAITFTANQGDMAGRIFLVADTNGVAGYQAGQDAVFELVNPAQPIIDPTPFI